MDNPKKAIEFRSDLELAEEDKSEGIQARQLPLFNADKREDAILEGGDFTPQKYNTRSGRQTKIQQPYRDDAHLDEGSE